jgi:hypothetical protein
MKYASELADTSKAKAVTPISAGAVSIITSSFYYYYKV